MSAVHEPCPPGLDPRDWRLFLARIEHHKAIADMKAGEWRAARLAAAAQRRPW